MQLREVWKKICRWVNEPRFLFWQTLLHKVPYTPIRINRFYLLRHTGIPEMNGLSVRGPGYIREAQLTDVDEMGELENKYDVFRQRLLERECGAVAIVDGKIVAYCWFSDKAVHVEGRCLYRIPIPSDSMYGYDLYIHPNYRMSGLWIKFMIYWGDLMRQSSRNAAISMVDYGNWLSMNTHIRFGFRPFKSVYVVNIIGKRKYIERDM